MRNGNYILRALSISFSKFLSYLWGMETHFLLHLLLRSNERSYPTYEEWKLYCRSTNWLPRFRFLSYLWGMETKISFHLPPCFFQFLSYLWGMETSMNSWSVTTHFVLILPMRNGNTEFIKIVRILNLFLSYLWGMETFLLETILVLTIQCSYPTYEEWKLYH